MALTMNETPSDKKPRQAADEGAIAVSRLRFLREGGVDLPGGNYGKNAIAATSQENRGTFELHYLPRLRHHRIVFRDPRGGAPITMMIPEQWCSWEPAE